MKVYVLEAADRSSSFVLGVFTTLAEAKASRPGGWEEADPTIPRHRVVSWRWRTGDDPVACDAIRDVLRA